MAAGDGLSDAEWQLWERFFPPQRGRVGQPATIPTRTFLDALLWMTGEGARWRALPERCGSWNTIWRRFARWRDQGVFEAAFEAISQAGLADERLQMIDSTVVRAHQHAAGARQSKGAKKRGRRTRSLPRASRPSSTSAWTRTECRSPSHSPEESGTI